MTAIKAHTVHVLHLFVLFVFLNWRFCWCVCFRFNREKENYWLKIAFSAIFHKSSFSVSFATWEPIYLKQVNRNNKLKQHNALVEWINVWMNEWMMHLYSALLCIGVHPKRFTIMWGGGLFSSIHLDDATAATEQLRQCVRHTPATVGEKR